MNIRKHATTGLLTIGVLVALPASLQADDMAYMLGTAALGVQNPLGIVDLKTGVFTLIGNMGSGGYDGLAVCERCSLHRTERTPLFGQHQQRKSHPHRRAERQQSRHVRLNHHWTVRPGRYGFSCGGDSIFDQSPDGRHDDDRAARRQRRTQRPRLLCEAFRRLQHAVHGVQQQSLHHQHDNRRGHAGGNDRQ